jgi:hypothetical protein
VDETCGRAWSRLDKARSTVKCEGNTWCRGLIRGCVTAWYDSPSLLKSGGNALVWSYINASQISKLMKNKLSLLTFRDLEDNTVLAVKLNFLERGQILGSIADAVSSRAHKQEAVY